MTITDSNNDPDEDEEKKYIVGVTLPRAEGNGTLLRFLKINHAVRYIERVIDGSKPSGAIDKFCSNIISRNSSSSSRENTSNKPSKRPRLQESRSNENE